MHVSASVPISDLSLPLRGVLSALQLLAPDFHWSNDIIRKRARPSDKMSMTFWNAQTPIKVVIGGAEAS